MTNPTTPSREQGSTTLSTLIGAVLGAVVIGGFMSFVANANGAGATFAERSLDQSSMAVVRDRLLDDLDDAGLPVALTPTTATARQEDGEVVRWAITALGDLTVQYGHAMTTDWTTIPSTVRLRDLGPFSGFSVESEDPVTRSALVRVALDLPGGASDPEVNTVVNVGAGVEWQAP